MSRDLLSLNDAQNFSVVLFSDVNADYERVPASALVLNEDSVYQSIMTIFGTPQKSRVFRRRFGSRFHDYLFDPIDERTAMRIEGEIPQLLAAHEPRFVLRVHRVLPDYQDQSYYVEISGTIPQLENKLVTYRFNMRR